MYGKCYKTYCDGINSTLVMEEKKKIKSWIQLKKAMFFVNLSAVQLSVLPLFNEEETNQALSRLWRN